MFFLTNSLKQMKEIRVAFGYEIFMLLQINDEKAMCINFQYTWIHGIVTSTQKCS